MHTSYDVDNAERRIAKVEQTKVMIGKFLEQNLGFIADKDFKSMLLNVAEALDDGAYHEVRACQKIIDESGHEEQRQHERADSTFYVAKA